MVVRKFWLTVAVLLVSMPAGAQTIAAPALHQNGT